MGATSVASKTLSSVALKGLEIGIFGFWQKETVAKRVAVLFL